MRKIILIIVAAIVVITFIGVIAQALTRDDLNDTINMIIVPVNTAFLGVIVVLITKLGGGDNDKNKK